MNLRSTLITTALAAFVIAGACKKGSVSPSDSSTTTTTTSTTGTGVAANVPDIYKKIYGATDIYLDGDYVVIKATSLPDHKSPYYIDTKWASKYEAYNGTNTKFGLNPNRIAENDCTYRIPLKPALSSAHSATPLGPMGVAINGVPIFNQYAAQRAPLTDEANGFDQYGGHPQQQGEYHYHVEPTYLTAQKGKDALVGFLLDGFPVYGPLENGKTITNADLDVYHGHTSATADYPNGIYHYHITSVDPYINGNGFYGTPGTVSQ